MRSTAITVRVALLSALVAGAAVSMSACGSGSGGGSPPPPQAPPTGGSPPLPPPPTCTATAPCITLSVLDWRAIGLTSPWVGHEPVGISRDGNGLVFANGYGAIVYRTNAPLVVLFGDPTLVTLPPPPFQRE